MADTFKQHLATLPQELYDKIFDLTFTPFTSGRTVRVTEKRRFPKLLRVSSATRQLFASRYFHNTNFAGHDYIVMLWWMAALETKHLGFLTSIRVFVDSEEKPIEDEAAAKRQCVSELAYMMHYRMKGYIDFDAGWRAVSVEVAKFGRMTFATVDARAWA